MNVTIEQLMECIDKATVITTVLVESSDWHNESGWTTSDIMYVCPVALKDSLKEILDNTQKNMK